MELENYKLGDACPVCWHREAMVSQLRHPSNGGYILMCPALVCGFYYTPPWIDTTEYAGVPSGYRASTALEDDE